MTNISVTPMAMNMICFCTSWTERGSAIEWAQMLTSPSAERTTTATSTGQLVAMASCFQSLFIQLGQNRPARSEERRVGKECRSRCDWSSDVCSSDLPQRGENHDRDQHRPVGGNGELFPELIHTTRPKSPSEIGRASCRERV